MPKLEAIIRFALELETSDSASSFSFLDRWENKADSEDDTDLVMHGILIANYKENIEVLIETQDVLASYPQAKHAYDVFISFYQ